MLESPTPLHVTLFDVTRQLQLQGFWTHLLFSPVADMSTQSGTTWLETMVMVAPNIMVGKISYLFCKIVIQYIHFETTVTSVLN